MTLAKNDSQALDQANEIQFGTALSQEQLDTISGGVINSFMCPACGEQVNYVDSNRPYTCPFCKMPC